MRRDGPPSDDTINREERKRVNPLLEHSLGDLIVMTQQFSHQCPDVLLPKVEVPEESLGRYDAYRRIVEEINRREGEYQSPKRSPLIGGSGSPITRG